MIEQINNLVYLIVISGCISATILMTLEKWKFIEWMQLHSPKWFPSDCYLCMSFWVNNIAITPLFIIDQNYLYLVVPFCATSITKFLIFK